MDGIAIASKLSEGKQVAWAYDLHEAGLHADGQVLEIVARHDPASSHNSSYAASQTGRMWRRKKDRSLTCLVEHLRKGFGCPQRGLYEESLGFAQLGLLCSAV